MSGPTSTVPVAGPVDQRDDLAPVTTGGLLNHPAIDVQEQETEDCLEHFEDSQMHPGPQVHTLDVTPCRPGPLCNLQAGMLRIIRPAEPPDYDSGFEEQMQRTIARDELWIPGQRLVGPCGSSDQPAGMEKAAVREDLEQEHIEPAHSHILLESHEVPDQQMQDHADIQPDPDVFAIPDLADIVPVPIAVPKQDLTAAVREDLAHEHIEPAHSHILLESPEVPDHQMQDHADIQPDPDVFAIPDSADIVLEPIAAPNEDLTAVLVEPVTEDGRVHLQTVNLFSGRMRWLGRLMGQELCIDSGDRLAFFRSPIAHSSKAFAFLPAWRMASPEMLDELTLRVDPEGRNFVTFNGRLPHGTWVYNWPATPCKYLDIQFSFRYGQPGHLMWPPPDMKWIRFQRIPGTETWVCCESDQDTFWMIMLCPI